MVVKKPLSNEERFELLSRLTYAAADMNDNKPDEKIFFTEKEPDILYDSDGDFYRAKPEPSIVGDLTSIEETESMREHQELLLKTAKLYEKKVGDKDDSLSTGINIAAQHDWSDVLNEVDLVQKKYSAREGSNSVPTLEDGFLAFEKAQPKVERWLALLPSKSACASRLCGGLRMILVVSLHLMLPNMMINLLDYMALQNAVCSNLRCT